MDLCLMFMLTCSLQGTGRGSVVVNGRSIHNQRIERLWRDVFAGIIISLYRYLFCHMESIGILDPTSNELHLFCLQLLDYAEFM